jgi:alcohol dehydrogenase
MKAAQIRGFGHPEVIDITEVDRPRAAQGKVVVEVKASSINPIDTKLREGEAQNMTRARPPFTLGFDMAGIVAEVGPGVASLNPGDKVYGQASVMGGGSGAFAQYAVTRPERLAHMPRNLSFEEAASIVLTGTSAWQAIYRHMKLQARQKVLIHGGAGGIGTAAIQIAKHIGAFVATTASAQRIEYVKQLGADQVIDYVKQSFEEWIADCDAVLDTVGGNTYYKSFGVLKAGGVLVSMLENPSDEMMRRHRVRAVFQFTDTSTGPLDELRKLIEASIVTVIVDRIYPLERIQEAFETKEHGHVRGKIAIAI